MRKAGYTLQNTILIKNHFGNKRVKAVGHSFQKSYEILWSCQRSVNGPETQTQWKYESVTDGRT